ncbi:SPRY7-like protein [Mya arenaria]|uniref:SPRY domain-containing protein 7 n=1 Tax=Mya arenaria TaxID=6604 RepID=A0ABY7G435_MYAAR|nr:SPRY7-like protein [Mya arenaria]
MADVFCCLRRLFGSSNPGHITLQEIPSVQLDTSNMGSEVVIVKSGVWGVGLATRKCGVDKLPLGDTEESWVLRHDGKLYHNGEERGKMPQPLQEGDVVGLTYDHVELNFRLNDKPTNTPFTGIKGTVYPVFYVDDGATLDVQFTNFYNTPPFGYDSIMIEQSLL